MQRVTSLLKFPTSILPLSIPHLQLIFHFYESLPHACISLVLQLTHVGTSPHLSTSLLQVFTLTFPEINTRLVECSAFSLNFQASQVLSLSF